ncbi:MAG: hypothetical protein QOK35_254, partial [Pseudonocardiales bacterium]|nr:hypothetical protein [Pseudonocardiales bacterium]
MENGTTTGAGAGSADGAAAVPAWSGAVDAGLVRRLRRPALRPGLVRLGHVRALLARHSAMAPGVPLAEVLLRRMPDGRPARTETPVVAGRPVTAPDPDGAGTGAAAPRADVRPPVPVVPATRVPVPAPTRPQLPREPRLEPPVDPVRARTADPTAADPGGTDGDRTREVVRPAASLPRGQQAPAG